MTPSIAQFRLSDIDRQDPVWIKLVAHAERRLEMCRMQNDDPLDPDKTAMLRGRIQELKWLIGLNTPMPIVAE